MDDLKETYAVIRPGDETNPSRQWAVVRASDLIERLRARATDEAWQEDATREAPLEAVAAYDSEGVARHACLMLNQAASTETGRDGDERLAKTTRFGTWGLPGIPTGADIHRETLRRSAASRRQRDGT